MKTSKNRKGLSSIVTTIIIIGVGLVAVGVIWFVINALIVEQTEGITYSEKCLKVNLEVISATCTALDCDVLIKRNSGGDVISGVKGIFYQADGTSEVIGTIVGDIVELSTVNKDFTITVAGPTKVEVYPYFTKADSSEHLCAQASTQEIS